MTKLSVLLCTDYLPPSGGGVEHVVETLAKRLDESGVSVTVYALKTADGPVPLREHDGIRVIESEAIDLTSIIGLQSAISPRALYDFPKVLGECDPDIVHVHNRFFFTSILARLCRHYTDSPLVTTLHVGSIDHVDGIGGLMAKGFETTASRSLVAHSDHVICVSKSVTDVATALDGTNVSVARNAVDIETYRPQTAPDSPLTLLYVGRLVRNNGPQDLIAALPAVLESNTDVVVEIVGSGHMKDDLQEAVNETGYADRITIHGYVEDLMAMYDRADVFCRPSYSEGLPLTLLESMACGVPPVVTPVAGVPEIVTDGENGRLVPCDDPATLATVLSELLADADERDRIATNARNAVEQNHSWDYRCDQVREIYETVLQSTNRSLL